MGTKTSTGQDLKQFLDGTEYRQPDPCTPAERQAAQDANSPDITTRINGQMAPLMPKGGAK